MSVAWSSESLLELAKSKAPADRERLLVGIVELCDAGDGAAVAASPQIQALLNSIFLGLVAGAEREIRKRLAEKLATADWVSAWSIILGSRRKRSASDWRSAWPTQA